MILDESYVLANGVKIPRLGLGTWRIDDDRVAQVVRDAVAAGYRHIDTAQAYANERGVGEGIRSAGVAREDLFVTTKLDAGIKDFDGAKAAIEGSLAALDLETIDLMLIHSPQPWADFRDGEHFFEGNLAAWRALEEAYAAGKLRAIGVSNFEQVDLENILEHGSVRPMVNQVLAHVGNTPFDLIDFAQANDMLVEAYSPVAHGKILGNAQLAAMADAYGVSIPQLCIRYCLQLGLLPLPKTQTPKHMIANASLDFEISPDDMAALKAAERFSDYGDASAFPVFGKQG
jgi:diketogulonate reductase-like aldo/keto reductase